MDISHKKTHILYVQVSQFQHFFGTTAVIEGLDRNLTSVLGGKGGDKNGMFKFCIKVYTHISRPQAKIQ